ncbi:MAG: DUF4300 family protein [Bacillota bacterium]|nr:DUF4300 family protein [Bacillota bacterium]
MKKILVAMTLALSVFLVSCQAGKPADTPSDGAKEGQVTEREQGETGKEEENTAEESKQDKDTILYSNMGDEASFQEVKEALKSVLSEESVDAFLGRVAEYNDAVENTGLTGAFKEKDEAQYDLEKLDALWASKKGEFIGTNCRLNSYLLLKDDIEVTEGEIDDALLVFDLSAIKNGKIFDEANTKKFKTLFSQVKTETTKDVSVHAKKMEEHLAKFKFNDKARMVSLVLHDNLDGDVLFIGHVGIMVEHEGKYLFVEKLSFQEPYQALKFNQKEDVYRYLYKKYKHFYDPSTAKPFIMDNEKAVDPSVYVEQ